MILIELKECIFTFYHLQLTTSTPHPKTSKLRTPPSTNWRTIQRKFCRNPSMLWTQLSPRSTQGLLKYRRRSTQPFGKLNSTMSKSSEKTSIKRTIASRRVNLRRIGKWLNHCARQSSITVRRTSASTPTPSTGAVSSSTLSSLLAELTGCAFWYS